MRLYSVPPDMNEKEKVIGGMLNLNQFFWILGGLGFGATIFAITFMLFKSPSFSATCGVPLCLTGAPFALYKKKGLTLYQLLKRKKEFLKKKHILINKRSGADRN